MAQRLVVNFRRVNGDNTGSWARSKPTKNSTSYGILYMRNCINDKTFYCYPEKYSNNFYKLMNPSEYKITKNNGKDVYIWVDPKSRTFESVRLEEIPSSKPPVQVAKPAPPKQVPKITGTKLSTDSSDINYKSASSNTIRKTVDISSLETFTNTGWTDGMMDELTIPMVYDTRFINNLSIVEKNLNIVMTSGGLTTLKRNMINNFNKYMLDFPDLELTKSFSHVFFTRPDLNLYESNGMKLLPKVSNDPVYYYLDANNRPLLRTLTEGFSPNHDFNPFLSNMARSFETTDEMIEVLEHGETFTGFKVKYGKHNIRSKTAGSFSITYRDDKDFNVYKLHKAWVDYISKVYRGELVPKNVYIRDRILDYACTVYYFICGSDGETILYWAKYTGVFPTNTPSGASAWSNRSTPVRLPEFNINYEYAWKEDFNPLALAEFNMNSTKVTANSEVKASAIYEPELNMVGKTFAGVPFIQTVTDTNTDQYQFKLKYRFLA